MQNGKHKTFKENKVGKRHIFLDYSSTSVQKLFLMLDDFGVL